MIPPQLETNHRLRLTKSKIFTVFRFQLNDRDSVMATQSFSPIIDWRRWLCQFELVE